MFANEKTAIFVAPGAITLSCAQSNMAWLGGWRNLLQIVIVISLLLFQASGSQTVFSFSPLIFFFFVEVENLETVL